MESLSKTLTNYRDMKKERPNELTYTTVNDCGFIVESHCRLPEIKCYEESGTVMFWASVIDTKDSAEIEALQYLTPQVAMKMSKALEACAIQALKNQS
jgi:hypothetical protein